MKVESGNPALLRASVIGAGRCLLNVASGPECSRIQEYLTAVSGIPTAVRRLAGQVAGNAMGKLPRVEQRTCCLQIVRGSAASVQRHRSDEEEKSTARSSDE